MSMVFPRITNILLISVLFALAGCGTAHYKKSADTEVYGIIDDKSKEVDGMPSHFDIEPEPESAQNFWTGASPAVLSLEQALEMAVSESRNYQSQKEQLYSQALALTLSRHQFDPIFSGSASGSVQRESRRNSVSGALSFGVSKMLATGADLSIDLTTNLFKFISSGDPAKAAASVLSASIAQPLLKGGGRKVALENLTQAERGMVYGIRDFVRFRKALSVNTAKNYFDVLQQKDQLTNAWNNYENLKQERARAELMAEAGRLPEFQVDQTEQDELRAHDNWVRTKQAYENLLDNFRIDLALSPEIEVELDPAELEKISAEGIVPPTVSLDEAVSIALENRLDLRNTEAEVEDAQRKVDVAINALKPGLDVSASVQANTEGDTKPLNFDTDNASYGAGADIELPLDRKAERNQYRQALINLEASKRALEEKIDRIKLEVREAYRNLDQAEKSYGIQQISLTLAERRVESTTLLQQAGRASTRDVLEARAALLEAQNALSRALVDHFKARLDLFLAMEILRVDDRGLWVQEDDIKSREHTS